jgi:hypothetical protein
MRTFLFTSLLILSVLILGAFGGDENSDYPSGSPAGYTGSPGDGHNCTSCHNGSATNVSGWITSNIPADGYTPGTAYTITVTVSGSGQKGFEVSPQNVSGALLGTLTAGSNNHLTGSGKYVTQNSKTSANPATWSFTWTAPAAGTGLVTFYGAFTVSKPVTKLSTLDVEEYVPPAALAVTASASPSLICSGETSQLNAEATGGSGNYTYSWSSIPAGFESTIANPVVSPTQATQYIVLVDDGVTSISDTTEVGVNQPPYAFAGNDTTYNLYISQIQLQGVATNFADVLWTTSGDGTFDNSAITNAVYFPGPGDKTNRTVNLTLTASPISPCSGNASSVINIEFDPNTGIDVNNKNSLPIIISPNPTQGIFYISYNGILEENLGIILYNSCGQMVNQDKIHFSPGMQHPVNISVLPKGIYFLRLQTDSNTVTKKIILN